MTQGGLSNKDKVPFRQFRSSRPVEVASPADQTSSVENIAVKVGKDDPVGSIQHSSQDILQLLINVVQYHAANDESPEFLARLSAFSHGVNRFSNVLEAAASSLELLTGGVWLTFHTICQILYNRTDTSSAILTALCDVAGNLPGSDLSQMYDQSSVLTGIILRLYTYIDTFFNEVLNWYRSISGRPPHSKSAFPVLCYDDTIKAIKQESRILELSQLRSSPREISSTRSPRAENQVQGVWAGHTYGNIYVSDHAKVTIGNQHHHHQDVSNQLTVLTSLVESITDGLARDRAVHADGQIHCPIRLSSNETTQFLRTIEQKCRIDHKKILQDLDFLAQRQQVNSSSILSSLVESSRLQSWNAADDSSSLFIKGSFKNRFVLRQFCVNVVKHLLSKSTVVLNVLFQAGKTYIVDDILASLVIQALQSDKSTRVISGLRPYLTRNPCLNSKQYYLNLLTEVLSYYPLVFIVVNMETMSAQCALEYRKALGDLVHMLAHRKSFTKIRVLSTSQTPDHHPDRATDTEILKLSSLPVTRQRYSGDFRLSGRKRPFEQNDMLESMIRTRRRVR